MCRIKTNIFDKLLFLLIHMNIFKYIISFKISCILRKMSRSSMTWSRGKKIIILADIWLNNPTGNSELTGKRNLRFRNWMILKGMHILPYLKMVKIGGNYDGKFPCSF